MDEKDFTRFKSWLYIFVVSLLINDFEYVFTEQTTSLNIVDVISRNPTNLQYRMMIFCMFYESQPPSPLSQNTRMFRM